MGQALIIVDMQRYYFEGDHAEAARRLDPALACINVTIAAFVEAGRPVIFARTLHKADGSTWTRKMREANLPIMLEGSREAADIDGLNVPAASFSMVKTRHSAFTGTGLATRLMAMGVDHVTFCGAFTENCVAVSAIDAVQHDFRASIVTDACVASDPALGASVLDYCAREFEIELRECGPAAAASPFTLAGLR